MALYKCVHIANLADFTQADLEKVKDRATCSDCCSPGPNLWLCLHRGCLRIGCGEAHNDHSTLHNRHLPNHCVHINLSTKRLWCYRCQRETFIDSIEASRTTPPTQTVRYSPPPVGGDSGDSSDTEGSRDDSCKPRGDVMSMLTPRKEKFSGLTGLQNIGNTCYMNSALQALSNTPPLTQFFLECGPALVAKHGDKKPGLSKSYHRLVQEMWDKKKPGYVVPSGVLYGIRNVHPMFRGYQQHDTQEFLRCFMDQLHEELKEPVVEMPHHKSRDARFSTLDSFEDSDEDEVTNGGGVSSQSEGEEYETCDSGVSERSSLSEEGDRIKATPKRKLSRSPSPPHERSRTKLASQSSSGSRGSSTPTMTSGVVASGGASPNRTVRKKHAVKHRSIISDVFDGKLLSSVQCLTCDRVSTRVETFQDLSLPIPSRDHVHMIHQGSLTPQKGGLSACSDVYPGDQGWVVWLWEWFRSWFWGPTVSLHDCLAAFFSADELKGDNMYSCEKCNKLRNGVKYSKVLELPEVLCVHLKRFRHELMFSAKIGSFVTFPLEGLDMRPYVHKDCVSTVTSYNLVSVICHHGTAGGGHYTCYSFNNVTERWFEFDDQLVTEVSPETVQNCEAYVLFYKKSSDHVVKMRSRVVELIELSHNEPSLMQFYVSKQWINRFKTFAEPGPIDNSDFLCPHGGVSPSKVDDMDQLCTMLTQRVWEYLYDNFGGGPACNCLYECNVCGDEREAVERRKKQELAAFMQLNKEFMSEEAPSAVIYMIAMGWFRQWQAFVQAKGEGAEPPGPIDNAPIVSNKGGQPTLKLGSDYAQLSEELWQFFHGTYGGGPELSVRTPPSRGTASTPTPRSGYDLPLEHCNKSRSTENIHSNVAGAVSGSMVRPARAQSVSSDNITLRMAALSASGHRRLHDATSEQCLPGVSRILHDKLRRKSESCGNLSCHTGEQLSMKRTRSEGCLRNETAWNNEGSTGREGDPNRYTPSSLVNLFKVDGSGMGRHNRHDSLGTVTNQTTKTTSSPMKSNEY